MRLETRSQSITIGSSCTQYAACQIQKYSRRGLAQARQEVLSYESKLYLSRRTLKPKHNTKWYEKCLLSIPGPLPRAPSSQKLAQTQFHRSRSSAFPSFLRLCLRCVSWLSVSQIVSLCSIIPSHRCLTPCLVRTRLDRTLHTRLPPPRLRSHFPDHDTLLPHITQAPPFHRIHHGACLLTSICSFFPT